MAKQLRSVAATVCVTTLLMLFNLAFSCSGLAVMCIGIWMKLQLQDSSSFGIENSGETLLAVILLGKLVALVGIFACCCTTRQYPALLYLYGGFLAVITLLELGVGALIYTYRSSLVEGFDRGLNDSLTAYGTDKTKSFHVDMMQNTLHCCGNKAYTDWLNMAPSKVVPSSCCSVQEGECDTTDTDDIYTEGCYNRVIYFIKSNVSLVAGSAFGVAVFPLLGVFLSCCLANHINKIH
ncbi:PREDICTED: tetraspanin-6-like [Ceratosolen solmsi marchali]|uniref:Tetraspanin n=1 Tax=Ceratosolen solmsi marchali TaxID=326594 RepID=A0AAJ6YY35_9HYME|nr:PREDICTED: tetraspanin-6-like [Ceratosolen solmsi marchali]